MLAALRHHAATRPDAVAFSDGTTALTYRDLETRVAAIAGELFPRAGHPPFPWRCGLLLDNGLGWVAVDLAARLAGVVLVPIPAFFSAQQIAHVIAVSGLDALITDQPQRIAAAADSVDVSALLLQKATLLLLQRAGVAPALPGRTRKLTFTSGTTGTPKGVCLADPAIDRVAASLLEVSAGSATDRHLCLLPLAMLLENIAGVCVPLLAGATAVVPPLAAVGLKGSSELDTAAMLGAIAQNGATTIVTVPQTLAGLLHAIRQSGRRPDSLRLVAVGGAPLSPALLAGAAAMDVPVYQGYGLSEMSSVVAFNGPGANKPGSVGKPLPHIALRFAPDGEILTRGSACEGYLGADAELDEDGFLATGDLGHLDAEGFLHLDGRKKNMFITAFGRNVAPEWVECELSVQPSIAQAAVFGEAKPWNAAIIVPRQNVPDLAQRIEADLGKVNDRLPDYARIRRWLLAPEAFRPENGMLTPNGRLRRVEILAAYGERLEQLYEDEHAHVS
jgi:long-subunit acyl-CoA synthetase (AMP-forming)